MVWPRNRDRGAGVAVVFQQPAKPVSQSCIEDCRNRRDKCQIRVAVAAGAVTIGAMCLPQVTLSVAVGVGIVGFNLAIAGFWCARMAETCMDKCPSNM